MASSAKDNDDNGEVGQAIATIKAYARQETVGPLKGAGRWLAFGSAGAALIGIGVVFILLGILRLLQSDWGSPFRGRWTSIAPYAIVVAAAGVAVGMAVWRIGKSTLANEER